MLGASDGSDGMVAVYKYIENKMTAIDEMQPDCWINLVAPSEEEIDRVSQNLNIDRAFVSAALDEEETSRIEVEDGRTLIIIDVPIIEKSDGIAAYATLPLGIIVTEDNIVTICLKETPTLREFTDGMVKEANPSLKTRFIFTIFLRAANRFLQYLRDINKLSSNIERQLYKSQRNKELIQLLDLEKSLVYFTTSLKADELTLNKILRGRIIKLYEDDQDLLEDVLIEIKQAMEMADIYSSILSGMMDAFASVISNNLNVIMKTLTSVTILITIPNVIYGFFGMNFFEGPVTNWWFPLALSVSIMLVAGFILKRTGLF